MLADGSVSSSGICETDSFGIGDDDEETDSAAVRSVERVVVAGKVDVCSSCT